MSQRKVNKDYAKNKKSAPAKQEAAPVPELAQSSGFSLNHIRLIAVFLFAFVLYGNTLPLSYAIDDAIVITSNQFTKKGISGIKDIMTKDTFHGFFGENKQLVSGGRYRPLSLVTFAIEWDLFKDSPAISHFINVILYGLTGLLLLKVLEKLVKRKPNETQVLDLPFITTLLFMAHPLHTEVVANIKGRDEILSLLFSLTATYLLILYNEKQKIYFFILSCIVLILPFGTTERLM